MDILCAGGGPGGIFFAISAKRHHPDHRVTLVERRPDGTTYGWGIAVSAPADHRSDLLHAVRAGDPETAAAIEAAAFDWHGQQVVVQDRRPVHLGGAGYCLTRQALIDILLHRARELGVEVRFGTDVASLDDAADADLVVLADGARSRLRRSMAHRFGTRETAQHNRYAWLGMRAPLPAFRYAFERTPAGWIWFYGYPHAADASTIIVECSPATWSGLGLGADDAADAQQLSEIFARHLGGYPLESRGQTQGGHLWESFLQVRNDTWHAGNVVLLGDAAHTAHFSIGSGTTLAMQDAAVLGRVLASCRPEELPAALQRYEDARRPVVEDRQEVAERSADWFEHVDDHIGLDPLRFGYALKMRRAAPPGEDLPRSPLLYGAHLATQWRIGRGARRLIAVRRRAAQAQRAPHDPAEATG